MPDSSIDEVIESTTLPFKKPITLDESKKLLGHVARHLPSDIHFNASYNGSFYHADGKISEQKGSVKISGSIIKREEPYPFDYFVAFCDRENTSLIAGIEFNRTPDWDLNDYPESVRQLWDDVRKIVNNYFNTNYPSAGN